jgi:hypothetical protein
MLKHALVALVIAAAVAGIAPADVSAQSDLDTFMERVLARRDDNWQKLQQYVLEEREAFDLTGPGGLPLFGFRRDYQWFIKQGVFVRSPLRANGVAISDADRRKAEDDYLRRERNREERRKRRAEREAKGDGIKVEAADSNTPTTAADQPSNVEDLLRQGAEPRFVSAAYFLKFKFESGRYALAGREQIDDVETLKIEYYPTKLFSEENEKRARAKNPKAKRDEDEIIEEKMNKVSMVTIWVDPKTYQILQYTFDDIEMDFLPGRALARVDDLKATMRMTQAFPGVWLPKTIDMKFEMTFAIGTVDANYGVDYHDYKEAAVSYKIKP